MCQSTWLLIWKPSGISDISMAFHGGLHLANERAGFGASMADTAVGLFTRSKRHNLATRNVLGFFRRRLLSILTLVIHLHIVSRFDAVSSGAVQVVGGPSN